MNSHLAPTTRHPVRPLPASLELRAWQQEAVPRVLSCSEQSFLLAATPGGGKTIPALVIAHRLLRSGEISRIVVVAPTSHLTRQWADDAHRLGINLTPRWEGQREPTNFHGIAITYQRVRHGALALAAGCREATLVIADEPHHLGRERSWAAAFEEAFAGAPRWLLLSGTPFRSDGRLIPGVRYDNQGYSDPDFTYSYADAIRDGVCRRISFVPYDGTVRWADDGLEIEADFDDELSRRGASCRHRTAISPTADGLERMVTDAYTKLVDVRRRHRDAAMLIVCDDINHAARTAELAARISGQRPVVVTSDDPEASRVLKGFKDGDAQILVAVNMVSEGVDIPRLRVGVYATTRKTQMSFRQIVGRFVRTGSGSGNDCSFLFMPADARLRELAAEIESEIQHQAEEPEPPDEPVAELGSDDEEQLSSFVPLEANVHADGALLSGTRVADAEEAAAVDTIARKNGWATEEVLRRLRGSEQPTSDEEDTAGDEPDYEVAARLRGQRKKLVGRLAYRTGRDHAEINSQINQATAGGRSVKDASIDELRSGNRLLERLLAETTVRSREVNLHERAAA